MHTQSAVQRSFALISTALLLAGVLSAGGTRVAGATTTGWSEPIKVSPSVPHHVDWFPSVAADDDGNVHIVWSTGPDDQIARPDDSGGLEYTRWDGQSWTKPTDLALIWYGYVLRNSIAAAPDGRVHMLVKSWGDLGQPNGMAGQDIYYMSASPQDASSYRGWSAPVRVTAGPLAYYAAIALDSKGTIHALWTETDTAGQFGLYYAHSSDGGANWSGRIALEDSEPVWWYRAQMKVDAQDQIHVVYELGGQDTSSGGLSFGTTRSAVYSESIDGGLTWSRQVFSGRFSDAGAAPRKTTAATSATDATPGPQQPAIGIDGHGNRLLVFRDGLSGQLLFRQSADGVTWSMPQPLPGITRGVVRPYDVFDMVTDSAGHVHLASIGYPSGSSAMSVLHSEWNGQNWSRPDVVASGPPYPEYPRLAIARGNQLHLVWFSGDKETTDRTPVGVWYSTITAGAPTLIAAETGALSPPPFRGLTVAAPPTEVPAPVPTVATLPEASRVYYEPGRSGSGVDAWRDMTGLPLYAGLIVAAIILGTVSVLYVRRSGYTRL